jgi:dihydroorotase
MNREDITAEDVAKLIKKTSNNIYSEIVTHFLMLLIGFIIGILVLT